MGKQKVVEILMERDKISESEAKDLVDECVNHCLEALDSGDIEAPFDIIVDDLGLEPDYLQDILPF